MASKSLLPAIATASLLVFAQTASAHPGHGTGAGFAAGAQHPLSGIDHILAMIAVGLCAAQIGGRATWLLPATFLACMLAGGMLALGGTHVPMLEQGIMTSVLVLGLIIAMDSKLGTAWTSGLVGLFALFHGFAHGAEMNAGLSRGTYALGFVAATTTLMATGLGAGLLLQRRAASFPARVAGGAIAVCGVLMFAGVI